MGPRPLPVSFEEGGPKGPQTPKQPKEKPEEGWIKFLADRATSGANALGQAGVGAAGNQMMPGVQALAGAAASGLARLGPAGLAAAASLTAVTAGATAFGQVVDAFVRRGRELAGLDARLASASAQADMTRMRADFREANQLGPQMAKLIEQQAKAEATFREIALPIKTWVLTFLNASIELGLKALLQILEIAMEVKKFPDAALMLINPGLIALKAFPNLEATVAEIKKILAGEGDIAGVDKWLEDLGKFVPPPARGAAPPPAIPPDPLAPFPRGAFPPGFFGG